MNSFSLSYLSQLEAESIDIMREVAAEFKNPAMLYSVGKDSSVMVRLAQKAFYPGRIPFPLMHVDTGYKFPEMYKFRDEFQIDGGMLLVPGSHNGSQGATTLLPVDYGPYSFLSSTITRSNVGRDYGIQARGRTRNSTSTAR